jgi:7,8-dihydropterin-6-yl-methyl-4-(beta-D-ribofuranosyl)aminobenzene 5'-phosphate synthase
MYVMYAYKNIALALLCGWALFMTHVTAANGTEKEQQVRLRLHVVFNNVPYKAGLATSWGFSCLIEGLEKTVLFDTGGDGDILLSNMRQLGLDAKAVEVVVLSHIHSDHTGGLGAFLAHNPDVTVYVPDSFPASFRHDVEGLGATIETVTGPRQLMNGVHTTGEMNHGIKEQAMIVDTPRGLIVITGCAHPNVADMAEQAKAYLNKNIYLLMGGFHLGGSSDAQIHAIIQRLKTLGVEKIAPSHCTGDNAIRLFREEWKEDFIEGGLGAVIEVSWPSASVD